MASNTRLRASLVKCGSCGKRYANPLAHTCTPKPSRRRTRTRLAPKVSAAFTCGSCGKQVSNLLTHTCKKRSDFRQRKRAAARQAAAERRDANRHDYAACPDRFCDRFPCKVYREGFANGKAAGQAEGYAEGLAEGQASASEA